MVSFLVSRENLTPDQLRAVEFNCDEHRVIAGGPGSGKTIVILHRARYLVDRFHVDHNRYRIFVFTKVLKEYIRSSLDLLGLPDGCVTTFDSWCVDFYKRNISRSLPKIDGGMPDFNKIRISVKKHLEQPLVRPIFDFVIVDEGQDLDKVAYEILTKVAKHISVFMDHKQQVYQHGTTENDILSILGLRRRNIGLLETYRCCPYIVSLASKFIIDKSERDAYLNQNRIPQTEKETPVLFIAAHFDDEMNALAVAIRARQNMGERIAILVPQKRIAYGLSKGLAEIGLQVEIPRKFKDADNCFDFSTPYPKIMPYPSAKGLTFDSVLIPRLVPRYFSGLTEDRAYNMLFVAVSRATKWVYMSTVRAAELKFFKGVVELEATKELTIRRSELEPDLFRQGMKDKAAEEDDESSSPDTTDVTDFF